MESTLTEILNLIHARETSLRTELKSLGETKQLLVAKGAAKDTGRPANGEADADAIPDAPGGWSAARRARHSRMMKKRWAARKRAK